MEVALIYLHRWEPKLDHGRDEPPRRHRLARRRRQQGPANQRLRLYGRRRALDLLADGYEHVLERRRRHGNVDETQAVGLGLQPLEESGDP